MSLADELQKLSNLRREGTLTDAEFADAKRQLLADVQEAGEEKAPSNGGAAEAESPGPGRIY